MEWLTVLLLIVGGFLFLLCIGLPVAFAFTCINIIGAYVVWGGEIGLGQLILSIYDSVTSFSLLPIAMFVIMGDLMFHSGLGIRIIDTIDVWIGRIPGRLSLLTVMGGALFATMSGSSIGTTALLGTTLVPQMQSRGYQKPMSLGPVLGSGGLAIMIPPSGLGVILAVLANISLGKLLIAILIPGLMMALFYALYIVVRCFLQPSIAPAYEVIHIQTSTKVILSLKYILPLTSILFFVLGFIFLGIATPSESAALGALCTLVLTLLYRRMSLDVAKKSISGTVRVTGMVLMIITGSTAFSQILAFTGATKGLIGFVLGLAISPMVILLLMFFLLILLGTFMEPVSIMMITIPIFMPIVNSLQLDPVWFGTIMLLIMEMAQTSPPFGLLLFVMKGVAPPGTSLGDCIGAAIPFLLADLAVVIFIIVFPPVALWLPGLMS